MEIQLIIEIPIFRVLNGPISTCLDQHKNTMGIKNNFKV